MEFLIKPRFRALNSALYFQTESLNALARAEYNDKLGVYQARYGLYTYMQMTSQLTFKIHYPEGTPFMWQPHKNCAWTPTGTLSMNQKEITPCRSKINEQFCYDENLDGTFQEFLRHGGGATIQLSQAGIQYTNELIRTIVKNATLGARMTMVGGQLIDLSSVTFETGAPARIEDAYRRTAGTCKGWIELARQTALIPGNEHLDGSFIQGGDISSDGKTFTGSTVDLYDSVFDGSPTELQDSIIEGGVGGFGSMFYPIFAVSPSIYRAIIKDWKAQKVSPLMNEPRITRIPIQVPSPNGQWTMFIYFIDDTVVIPISDISHFDKYVTGTSHFCYLTISGVIQLGGSFADIPKVSESEVSVMVQVSEDAEDYGTYKFLSHGLMATAINDTNYLAGDYVYAEPS